MGTLPRAGLVEKNDRFGKSEGWITLSIFLLLTLVSTVLVLRNTSPELSWDEADYAWSIFHCGWGVLWSTSYYARHSHGPLALYLAKLGRSLLPVFSSSVEFQLRLPVAIFGSLAVGITYWGLRHGFGSSRAAASVGATLLLFSVIRLQDTNVIGPHYPMLTLVILISILGYRWRAVATLKTAIALGIVFGVALVTMTYAIPLAAAWMLSIIVAGSSWVEIDRFHLKIAWPLFVVPATAVGVATLLWPPSVLEHAVLDDFLYLTHYAYHPTLVGTRIVERTPRIAALYWLSHLEAPILITSIILIPAFVWRRVKQRLVAPKDRYLLCFLSVFLAAALSAYIAGSRNLLLVVGVLCLTLGAVADDVFENHPALLKGSAVVVVVGSIANLIVLSRDPDWVPYLATDGYRAFIEQNRELLSENATAIVNGSPILRFYLEQAHTQTRWNYGEIPWTTLADAPLPYATRYALVSELVYRYMPPEQPVRRVICRSWKVVWSFKSNHTWGLRLYERPCLRIVPGIGVTGPCSNNPAQNRGLGSAAVSR